MKKIREIIEQNSTGKKVLLLFVLTNLVYALMLLVTIPKTMAFSNGLKLLDMMPLGYSPEYIKKLLETLGEQGRQVYLTKQIPVDMIYPLLFGLSYSLMMGYFLKKLSLFHSFYYYLCFLPVIAGVSDYIENFGIMTMLNSYPDLSPFLMKVTNVFTVVKSISTSVYFIALLITLLLFGIQTLKKRKKANEEIG